jgi:branched-chain amino acid transport system permease protein
MALLLLMTALVFGASFAIMRFGPKFANRRAVIGSAGLTLAMILPHLWFANDTGSFFPLFTIVLCAVYALFALGLNVVVGYAGLLDLGYVAFFLFGAYVGAWLTSDFAVNLNDGISFHFFSVLANKNFPGIHISFWFVLVIAGFVTAVVGVIIGAPTLRLKSDYLALVTLGFGEILPEVFRNGGDVFGLNLTNGTKGIGPIDSIGTGWLAPLPLFKEQELAGVSRGKYYIILVLCALFVWVSLKLRDGKLGRAWMAIREDELAASLMGVPLMRTKLWSYAVGAVAGGVGGAFYATIVGTVNVDNFTFNFSIIILCAVILGGMGNVWGSILGGVIITWFNYTGLTWISGKLGINLKQWEFAFFGIVLVLMMLFRPEGFLPAARSKQVREVEKQIEAAQEATT